MKNRFLHNALVAGFAFGMMSVGHAQTTQTTHPPVPQSAESVGKLDSSDRSFLSSAAESNAMEIEGSKLALEKGHHADVKTFAQKMIDDHTKLGQTLAALAKSKGYDAPTEPSLIQKGKLKMLGMRDEGFDEAYVKDIGVAAHEDAVELFQKASQDAKDPDVKQFATQAVPSLQQHLEAARALQQAVKPVK